MYIIVDNRPVVTNEYVTYFDIEGVESIGLHESSFNDWLDTAPEVDMKAVQGFLLGDCEQRPALPRAIQKRSFAPIIAMIETRSLDDTLELLSAGIDNVVRKPVHVREIIARAGAVRRRYGSEGSRDLKTFGSTAQLKVYFDGRDPEIDGVKMTLPRRERQILEFLIRNQGRWMRREQVFNAVYGAFTVDIDETVIESHVSKLRKKLRQRLNLDPIEVRRYLGYAFVRG